VRRTTVADRAVSVLALFQRHRSLTLAEGKTT